MCFKKDTLKKLFVLIILLSCLGLKLSAQTSLVRLALKDIEKKKWTQAEGHLKKAIGKDTLSPLINYVYSQWYFALSNPRHHVDSSYTYLLKSLHLFLGLTKKQQEKIKRFPLDSNILIRFRKKIDSAAFEKSKQINSEAAYNDFLDRFIFAQERDQAIALRNEVSFLKAVEINTYQSFRQHFTQYPRSHWAEEAKSRYEKLLFEQKIGVGSLEHYVSFYKKYPSSPYLPEVEKNLFEMITASGKASDFLSFIKQYPESKWVKRAKNMAYYIAKSENHVLEEILDDSLKQLMRAEKEQWFPFLEGGYFGFMSSSGHTVLPPQYNDIKKAYWCRGVGADYLITPEGILNRLGQWIYKGMVVHVTDLGLGILQVQSTQCSQLLHKSGDLLMTSCIEKAKIMRHRFLAVRSGGQWGLMALNGRLILDMVYEEIRLEGPVFVLTKNGKEQAYTVLQVLAIAAGKTVPPPPIFDEVEELDTHLLLVREGDKEGVLDEQLNVVVPLEKQHVVITPLGIMKKRDKQFTPIGISKKLNGQPLDAVMFHRPWTGLYKNDSIMLYHSSTLMEEHLDSLWFEGVSALAIKKDTLYIFLDAERKFSFPLIPKIKLVKSSDTVNYFYYYKKGKNHVFDMRTGDQLFLASFESINYLGYDLFHIVRAGKAGVVDRRGQTVLKLEYKSIIASGDHLLALLKDEKIGLYDMKKHILIPPVYERHIVPYNDSIWVAYQQHHYGFLDIRGNPLSAFEFDEITYWNDSSALVKKDKKSMIYSIYKQQQAYEPFDDYQLLKNQLDEKIAIVQVGDQYGLLSSTKGMVIPMTLNMIRNIGTVEDPFYFTEKYIKEADIYIALYYDKHGDVKKKQIYEKDKHHRMHSLFEDCSNSRLIQQQ